MRIRHEDGRIRDVSERAYRAQHLASRGWTPVEDDGGHVCGTCGFEAKSAGGLTSHERTHDG